MSKAEEAVQAYLQRMSDIRATGSATRETAYYSALEVLLNIVGSDLKPKVICNAQLANTGAGSPDFGLYAASQLQKGAPRKGQMPERGVVEVKGLSDDTVRTASTPQAVKYFDHYRLVLVTNYREFRLIGEDSGGLATDLERFSLADDEAGFWKLATQPSSAAKSKGPELFEFLSRVLRTAAPLRRAEDVAWFLASYARDALRSVKSRDSSALAPLRSALETALGVTFQADSGDAFFRSTLVQTLFYGVFSAWVDHARVSATPFDWRAAAFGLRVPMVAALFEEIARPTRLLPLGLIEPLDRATSVLNRIDRGVFLGAFDTAEAVQHFYEPFLAAFDPALRKQLGVWYTPPEIVAYMVERVDRALREEMGRPNGLADPDVVVLDPCCGTGAYVVAVLDRIARTLEANGGDALDGEELKAAAQHRIFGFELMPAPFVVAHWRVGAFLAEKLRRQPGDNRPVFDGDVGERAAVYLTNALTGWETPDTPPPILPFPGLEEEREAAGHIKQNDPILVILGNPPYNAFAGVAPPGDEAELVRTYKSGLSERWGIAKYNLDDLYVRFLRVAERRIGQSPVGGIVSFISNASYVQDASFAVLRERLATTFDLIEIDNLNGDSRETGKLTPEGTPDPSIFSTRYNPAGIQVGTAIGLFVRREERSSVPHIRWRQFWGMNKRRDLLATLEGAEGPKFKTVKADPFSYLAMRPHEISETYKSWPALTDLAAKAPLNGLMEKRGGALKCQSRADLEARMRTYFDEEISWAEFERSGHSLARNMARHNARQTRADVIEREVAFDPNRLVTYFDRPFETTLAYYSGVRTLWNEPRPDLWLLFQIEGNAFLASRPARAASAEGAPMAFTTALGDNDALRGHAYYFADQVLEGDGLTSWPVANLSIAARRWLSSLGEDAESPTSAVPLWRHALAIGHSPRYRADHRDGLSVRWPRIPMPASADTLRASATLGLRLAALLNTLEPVPGVSSGSVEPALRLVGGVSATDLSLEGWGSKTSDGKVQPGQDQSRERAYSEMEIAALSQGIAGAGLRPARILELLGPALDIPLNATTAWTCVPKNVWDLTIGGYQPIKKWLSYRDRSVINRPLSISEAREVTGMIRRLTAIVLLSDALDANYAACATESYSWPESELAPLVRPASLEA